MVKVVSKSSRNLSVRIAAVLTAAVFAMSMTACSSAEDTLTDTSGAAADSSAQQTDTAGQDGTNGATEAVTEESDTADAEAQTEDSSAGSDSETADSSYTAYTEEESMDSLQSINENPRLQMELSEVTEENAAPEGQTTACATKLQWLTVRDSGYDALQTALDADHEEAMQLMSEQVVSLYTDYGDVPEGSPAEDLGYAVEDTVLLKRADEKVVSYLHCNYCNFGGAHPTTGYSARNYDTKTGEALSFKDDIAADYDGIYQYVMEKLAKSQEENGWFFEDYEQSVGEIFYGPNGAPAEGEEADSIDEAVSTMIWYMTDDGATIVFDTYSIAPYAIGPTVVQVPFSTGLLNTEYQN